MQQVKTSGTREYRKPRSTWIKWHARNHDKNLSPENEDAKAETEDDPEEVWLCSRLRGKMYV